MNDWKDRIKKNEDEGIERRQEMPWAYCSRHDVKYPRGSECPKCRAERKE